MPAALLWLRRDLRLADNPALQTLLDAGYTPVPVYIHDEPGGDWPLGEASAWWLHHSLTALQRSLRERGSDLLIFRGDPKTLLPALLKQADSNRVAWNRCYEPAALKRDQRIEQALKKQHCEVSVHNAALLREPWQHLKRDETPYRVFTPFWKALYSTGPARQAIPASDSLPSYEVCRFADSLSVDALELLPARDWDKAFYLHWQPGEDGAWQALQSFRDSRLLDYPAQRDIPACPATSKLSPHLHFGEISPVQLWQTLLNRAATTTAAGTLSASEAFLRQLAWREFSYHLMYHFPATPAQPLDERFKTFPWRKQLRPGSATLATRRNRYPAGRRGYARTVGDRIYAQPRAHDCRVFPHQEPVDPLAGRRTLVLEHPGRCRSRQQHHGLAMDRRLRRRCRSILSDFQPGCAGREV